ncbi:MAG: MFS transporter [Ardenticatenaceae bacterium]|nr:MFS transporter [Anaerolineales bacterium]MCB8980872.1 MFS transporter [Ardenticatenaceae bacterium]
MTDPKPTRLYWQLALISLARLCLNTGLRMVYPFAPAFARQLDVPVTAVYRLVTIRNLSGFISPLFGPLSERFGRKSVLFGAMMFFSAGCLLVWLWPSYWLLGVALIFVALAKVVYDPAMQAYVGETVPYRQRGKALAVTELSWAVALLAGGPLIGIAIERQGWSAAFFWLGLFGVITAVFLVRFLPKTKQTTPGRGASLADAWRVVRQHPVIWAAMIYNVLNMGSNETIFLVFGDWMELSFGLSLLALGASASVIGGAEIMGELFAGWSVDHFGKRPVIITTGLLNALICLLIPLTAGNLTAALAAYFGLFLMFEITVVGGVPLMTEIVPSARSVVMSSIIAAGALGRAIGSWLGPFLFTRYGFSSNGVVSAIITAVATLILALWIREGQEA